MLCIWIVGFRWVWKLYIFKKFLVIVVVVVVIVVNFLCVVFDYKLVDKNLGGIRENRFNVDFVKFGLILRIMRIINYIGLIKYFDSWDKGRFYFGFGILRR